MKIFLFSVLGALTLAGCSVGPQYDTHRDVASSCGTAEGDLKSLTGARDAIAPDIYANAEKTAISADVAALLGGDYPDYASAGLGVAPRDYWRHIELRINDYRGACMGGAS